MSRNESRQALGKIIAVTAEKFVVELSKDQDSFTLVGFDAQHYVARIGSFVLIPLQTEYVVAEVVGLRDTDVADRHRIESEIHDSQGLGSTKYLDIVPIGSLSFRRDEEFHFGVSIFPPLYSDVLYAQSVDIDRILDVAEVSPTSIETASRLPTKKTAFAVGTSVIFDDYEVRVRVNEFFGGHSAILGNTGSGKSCTVASILQSIFTKGDEYHARGAAFIVFDTNGEYRQAFSALPEPIARRYAVVPERTPAEVPVATDSQESTLSFRVPHWYLSVEEWELLLRASDKTQRPVLRLALGLTSMFAAQSANLASIQNHVLASSFLAILQRGESVAASVERIRGLLASYSTDAISVQTVGNLLVNNFGAFTAPGNKDGELLHAALEQHIGADIILPDYENIPFEFRELGQALELAILYEESHGNRQIRDYCSSLLTRFKSIRDRGEFDFLRPSIGSIQSHEASISLFVDALMGLDPDGRKVSQITILDMNEVEDEVVEVISAVVARLVFERLRRIDPRNSRPVNLVLEEAHRYIPDKPSLHAIDAGKIFERIAKEGRKYGLFIMLASQRPSELSRTVLSQCSNFIVHRIQNPEDLTHIRQMTPFISEPVLKRLPALPKQHALIFGNSVNVPTTFRVRTADPRPKSDDARIADIWFVDSETEARSDSDDSELETILAALL